MDLSMFGYFLFGFVGYFLFGYPFFAAIICFVVIYVFVKKIIPRIRLRNTYKRQKKFYSYCLPQDKETKVYSITRNGLKEMYEISRLPKGWEIKNIEPNHNCTVDSSKAICLRNLYGLIPPYKEVLEDKESFLNFIQRRINELHYIHYMMDRHTDFWGVPCGPTLSMCRPLHTVGLNTTSFQTSADSPFMATADNISDHWPVENPFINDINSGLFRQDIIAKYNIERFIHLIQKPTTNKSPYDPYYKINFEYGFDLREWEDKLLSLINEVVDTEQPEVAIEALPIYDRLRKLMDIMQAVPPARRKTNDDGL